MDIDLIENLINIINDDSSEMRNFENFVILKNKAHFLYSGEFLGKDFGSKDLKQYNKIYFDFEDHALKKNDIWAMKYEYNNGDIKYLIKYTPKSKNNSNPYLTYYQIRELNNESKFINALNLLIDLLNNKNKLENLNDNHLKILNQKLNPKNLKQFNDNLNQFIDSIKKAIQPIQPIQKIDDISQLSSKIKMEVDSLTLNNGLCFQRTIYGDHIFYCHLSFSFDMENNSDKKDNLDMENNSNKKDNSDKKDNSGNKINKDDVYNYLSKVLNSDRTKIHPAYSSIIYIINNDEESKKLGFKNKNVIIENSLKEYESKLMIDFEHIFSICHYNNYTNIEEKYPNYYKEYLKKTNKYKKENIQNILDIKVDESNTSVSAPIEITDHNLTIYEYFY